MDKQLIRWTYLLGMVSLAAALLLRGLNALGIVVDIGTRGTPLGYMSFVKGALLLLIGCIASYTYTASKKA